MSDERIDQIKQDMDATCESLTNHLERLEAKAKDAFSLKRRVEGRPWTAIGAAVAAGLIVGAIRGGHNHDEHRHRRRDDE